MGILYDPKLALLQLASFVASRFWVYQRSDNKVVIALCDLNFTRYSKTLASVVNRMFNVFIKYKSMGKILIDLKCNESGNKVKNWKIWGIIDRTINSKKVISY